MEGSLLLTLKILCIALEKESDLENIMQAYPKENLSPLSKLIITNPSDEVVVAIAKCMGYVSLKVN